MFKVTLAFDVFAFRQLRGFVAYINRWGSMGESLVKQDFVPRKETHNSLGISHNWAVIKTKGCLGYKGDSTTQFYGL